MAPQSSPWTARPTRRRTRTWIARAATVALLAPVAVALPTISFAAPPKPVRPAERVVDLARETPQQGVAARHTARAVGRDEGHRFDVAGVTFSEPPAAGTRIEARVRTEGAWGPWLQVPLDDDATDPGTREGRTGIIGSDPIIAVGSDGIDVRVTSPDATPGPAARVRLIDAGRSAADGAVAPADSAAATITTPTIVTRQQWGADPSLMPCQPEQTDGYLAAVVHHTVNANTYTSDQVASIVRGIYGYHTQSLGWCDIGYQFIVDRFGRVFEGRTGSIATNVMGAQVGGFNSQTFGVAALGTFTTTQAPSATLSAIGKVIGWKAALNRFDPTATTTLTSYGSTLYASGTKVTVPRVLGHRQLSATACPGDALNGQLGTIRSAASAEYLLQSRSWAPMTATKVQETFGRPNGTSLTFAGHGYGHGRGLSQWGAYGAATHGHSASGILGYYYPGTAGGSVGNPTIRVELTALGTAGTTVVNQSGLYLFDGRTTRTLAARTSTGTAIDRWRVRATSTGLQLQWRAAGRWYSSGYWTSWTKSSLRFGNSTSKKVLAELPGGVRRLYPGVIDTSYLGGSKSMSINRVSMNDYLKAVVPAEMPASWPGAALQAQAVAARSFAAWYRVHPRNFRSDICDIGCQTYRGEREYNSAGTLTRVIRDARSDQAVIATSGQIRTYAGSVIRAEYSASNGGRTVYGGVPWMPARVDRYDGDVKSTANPTSWTASVPISRIEAAYPKIGQLRSLVVLGRFGGGDYSGRTTWVKLVGSTGSVTVAADQFRSATRLRSIWWTVTSPPARSASAMPRDVTANRLPEILYRSGDSLKALEYSGTMSFAARTVAASGWGTRTLVTSVGAFDQDNLSDVLARDPDGSVWLYPGDAAGTLTRARKLVARGWSGVASVVAVGDLSGDGYNDLVAVTTDGRLLRHDGTGTGSVGTGTEIATGWTAYRAPVAVDVNRDGRLDLVTVSTTGVLTAFAATSAHAFGSPVPIRTTDPSYSWVTGLAGPGDVTGDRAPDLVLRRANGALVVLPTPVRTEAPVNAGASDPALTWAG